MNNRQIPQMSVTGSTTGRRKKSSWLIGIMILLVALVIGSGIFVYYKYTERSQSTPVKSPTTTASGTPLASMSAAQLYQYVLSKPPTLVDSLDGSHADNWNLYMQGDAGCQFKNRALYVVVNLDQKSAFCFLRHEYLRDFAFQVQVQFGSVSDLDQFQNAGILFRVHPVQQKAYEFLMGRQSLNVPGSSLVKDSASLDVLNSSVTELGSWSGGVPNNMTSPNVLTVIALQNKLSLYINSGLLDTVTDPTFQGGKIGVEASDTFTVPEPPFEVAFRNMKLWAL